MREARTASVRPRRDAPSESEPGAREGGVKQ